MAKLQIVIDDQIGTILDKLNKRGDKARFVELAIRNAYRNETIREMFIWQDDNHVAQPAKSIVQDVESQKSSVEYDDDFQ